MLSEMLKPGNDSRKWARRDLNPRPIDYESTALTPELRAPIFQIGNSGMIMSTQEFRCHNHYEKVVYNSSA